MVQGERNICKRCSNDGTELGPGSCWLCRWPAGLEFPTNFRGTKVRLTGDREVA